MKNDTRIVYKHEIYKGYQELFDCHLEIPSLKAQGKHISIKREVIKTKDSVYVLLYVPAKDSFIFCEQYRTGVYFSTSHDSPFILEIVAGTLDSDISPEQTALKEVLEETGLSIEKVRQFAWVYKSPGIMTEKAYLFYSEVNEVPHNKIHGIDDEEIKTHVISRNEVYKMMDQMEIIDATTLLALNWFRANLKL